MQRSAGVHDAALLPSHVTFTSDTRLPRAYLPPGCRPGGRVAGGSPAGAVRHGRPAGGHAGPQRHPGGGCTCIGGWGWGCVLRAYGFDVDGQPVAMPGPSAILLVGECVLTGGGGQGAAGNHPMWGLSWGLHSTGACPTMPAKAAQGSQLRLLHPPRACLTSKAVTVATPRGLLPCPFIHCPLTHLPPRTTQLPTGAGHRTALVRLVGGVWTRVPVGLT